MGIFLTGSTGYIGAHVTANLLRTSEETLWLPVRARHPQDAAERLWRSLQLHMEFAEFREYLASRMRPFCGDITAENFGRPESDYHALVRATDSVIHCAASLNRKSEKSCMNVNLRGTLQVLLLALRARDHHGLRRFSHVSTVAVAGKRSHEVVREDAAIEWDRSDYDPYARTKKFSEHMVGELLGGVRHTIFRPSIVLGDSRRAATNQFEMVRAFVFLAGLPALPFRPTDRIDIVPVDYVADAVSTLHLKENPRHDIYHLSAGEGSETFQQLTAALVTAQGRGGPTFLPGLENAFSGTVAGLSRLSGKVGSMATLLKVFIPYLVWDTVFDNSRVVAEMGRAPVPFSKYCVPLLRFSREARFQYPYQTWPAAEPLSQATPMFPANPVASSIPPVVPGA